MYSGLTRRLVPLVKRFPRASGTFFMTLGGYAAVAGATEGADLELFRGGPAVEGRVEKVIDTSSWRPSYSADVAVELPSGGPVLERVSISRKEARVLVKDAAMPLVQARDGSPRYVRASRLKGAGLVDVGGRTVTFHFFLGSIFLLFGLWMFVAGPARFAEPPPRAPLSLSKGALGSRPSPR